MKFIIQSISFMIMINWFKDFEEGMVEKELHYIT